MHWQAYVSSAWRGHMSALSACACCAAQAMAFGKEKSIGMKRAKKKTVKEAETVVVGVKAG